MPAKSKAQRRLFGMAKAIQSGKMEAPGSPAAQIAASVPDSTIDEFAKTPEKGLPLQVPVRKPMRFRRAGFKKGMRRMG